MKVTTEKETEPAESSGVALTLSNERFCLYNFELASCTLFNDATFVTFQVLQSTHEHQ